MKNYYSKTGMAATFLFFALVWPQTLYSQETDNSPRPRIGLALSGGGARGFAHIGTLKLLDSLKIPVDYIAGTSMGSVVGALYAIGYSGKEIERLAHTIDWEEVFSDTPQRSDLPWVVKSVTDRYLLSFPMDGIRPSLPTGLIKGQKVFQILSKLIYSYQNVSDFNQLPIPFNCVAVDIVTGNEVVLDHGSLALAIRASMSIPTIFTPVEWGDSLLVDGFVLNNLPVDVVKAMGADIVIAVNVGTPKKDREHLTSILSIMEQTLNLASFKREDEAIQAADIVITPDLQEFSTTSFGSDEVNQIMKIGDRAALGRMDACVRVQNEFSLNRENLGASAFDIGNREVRLHGISIAGNTTLPFNFVYNLFDLKPGDFCTKDSIEACVENLNQSGYFKDVKYEIRPADDGNISLIINVKEKKQPVISGVQISGNKILPFIFIYNLLNIKPGMIFDTDIIDKKITELYALGYFETIHYEIDPVSEDKIRLHFHINEKPKRELNVGLRFNNRYKFVGLVAMHGSNVPFPGMRMQAELQFAGLIRFNLKASYPSRALTLPVYPFIRFAYKSVTIDIYEQHGELIATYPDRSTTFAAGLGFQISNFFNLEVEYNQENMDIVPEVALTDPTIFPTWDDRLNKIHSRAIVDVLDDKAFPSSGLYLLVDYEAGLTELGSEVPYYMIYATGSFYFSPAERHVIRLFGFHGQGTKDRPVYKSYYMGGPDDFIGLDYMQMPGYKVSIFRFDYRLNLNDRLYIMAIGAIGKNAAHIDPDFPQPELIGKAIWARALGLAIGINSPLGPLQITYGHGFNAMYQFPENRSYLFFTAGLNF